MKNAHDTKIALSSGGGSHGKSGIDSPRHLMLIHVYVISFLDGFGTQPSRKLEGLRLVEFN
jgi:hypothetical protein